MVYLEGNHGTSKEAALSIMDDGYSLSKGDSEWLGDGVYFFIEGVSSDPDKQAEKWAIVEAWDNELKQNKYDEYCVLKSDIEVEEEYFLDLTVEDGVEILNYLIDKIENKLSKISKSINFIDGYLINFARGQRIFQIDVAKGNFYIKFAKERIKRINLRTANCTICSVNNLRCIKSKTITIIGQIQNEAI